MKPREKEPEPSWQECLTFEAWVTHMLEQGYVEIVKTAVQFMTEEKKKICRDIYKRLKDKKNVK